MAISEMRDAIKAAPKYKDSKTWKQKVDWMSDAQVTAIYIRFKRGGII